MKTYGGWAGKVLRVDLSDGRSWIEDTVEKYKDYLGGTGIGYKVMWDEVPAETGPYDPENRIVFATGPLAGTSAPCNGRTAITTLWPTCWPKPLVATGHMGGHFAAKLKYAGYDAIVIQGKAERPVWLSIADGRVEINDARRLWGSGIRRATEAICEIMGVDAVVAAIGQAGENLVPMSVVMNSVSHSAGGIGSVMGSKNLKAIGVRGSGSIRIAGDRDAWEKLIKYHLSLLGANNQHVVPSSPQPWAEFHDDTTRWKGSRGRFWGAATRPVETGDCDPHNLNRIAYRSNNAAFFLGESAWQYTVRGERLYGMPHCMPHADQGTAGRQEVRHPRNRAKYLRRTQFRPCLLQGIPRRTKGHDEHRSLHGRHAPGGRPGHLVQLRAAAAGFSETLLQRHDQAETGRQGIQKLLLGQV